MKEILQILAICDYGTLEGFCENWIFSDDAITNDDEIAFPICTEEMGVLLSFEVRSLNEDTLHCSPSARKQCLHTSNQLVIKPHNLFVDLKSFLEIKS